jgi:hypothetical protein
MAGTNKASADLEGRLAAQKSVDAAVLAAANRARLGVLLDESRNKDGGSGGESSSSSSSEARYRAALRGESLGTHSRGTTVGAAAIVGRGKAGGGAAGGKG